MIGMEQVECPGARNKTEQCHEQIWNTPTGTQSAQRQRQHRSSVPQDEGGNLEEDDDQEHGGNNNRNLGCTSWCVARATLMGSSPRCSVNETKEEVSRRRAVCLK